MADNLNVEKLKSVRAGEAAGEAAPAIPAPLLGPSRAAARAGGEFQAGARLPAHDLDRMAEWHDPATARFLEQAASLRHAARGAQPLSLLGSVLGAGNLSAVPKGWLLAGDLLAVGSLIAGCTLTALALGPAGILATMAMEAVAYAGGVALTQAGQEQSEKAQRAALQQSAQDPSTGLLGQAATLEILEKEFEDARKSKTPLALMLIEVDQFDMEEGGLPEDVDKEEVLRHVAGRVRSAIREDDGLGLHGPSRLVAVVPGFPAAPAALVAERVRLAVASEPVVLGDWAFPITISLGVATTELAPLAEVPGLLKRAAQALYRARSRGRNRVVVAGLK